MRDVSRTDWVPFGSTWKTSVTLWGGEGGVKHNVKMTLFSTRLLVGLEYDTRHTRLLVELEYDTRHTKFCKNSLEKPPNRG